MPAHQRVRAWIASHYEKPAIDQEWLADCSDWIASELGLDPTSDFDNFIQNVEAQLLQSNLADSTVHGSGIDPLLLASNQIPARPRPSDARRPGHQAPQKKSTGPTPLLVEIKSITEIAHSAFNLLNTHQTRLDRADLGLARDEHAEHHPDEDEGPVPKFPRGMLKLELSDGLTTFGAIEFRSLPQLELATTPLGYKMFLKSTPIRNGIAFLEPENVILKGYRTEDHDVHREQVFLSSLRKRLGRPDPPSEELVAQPPVDPPAQPAPAQPARQNQPIRAAQPPPPPDDFDNMYVDDDVDPDVLREMTIQMDEEINIRENQRAATRTAPPSAKSTWSSKGKPTVNSNSKENTTTSLKTSSTSAAKASPYFTAHSSRPNPIPDIGLSPRPAPPLDADFDITWDIDGPEPSESLVGELCSTSAKPSSTIPAKRIIPSSKRPSSPDSYDDLSFDIDVDESFLEQVGKIEKGVLGTGVSNKGKGKGTNTESIVPHGRPSAALSKKTPTASALGTTHFVACPVSLSGAEPSTSVQGSRAPSASSVSGSTESFIPQSTQSTDRRLSRDPSLILISSEDEVQGDRSTARPLDLARRHAKKERKMDKAELVVSDVIDISD